MTSNMNLGVYLQGLPRPRDSIHEKSAERLSGCFYPCTSRRGIQNCQWLRSLVTTLFPCRKLKKIISPSCISYIECRIAWLRIEPFNPRKKYTGNPMRWCPMVQWSARLVFSTRVPRILSLGFSTLYQRYLGLCVIKFVYIFREIPSDKYSIKPLIKLLFAKSKYENHLHEMNAILISCLFILRLRPSKYRSKHGKQY